MKQKTKTQIALEHIKISIYALELIKARIQYDEYSVDEGKIENTTTKIKKVRELLGEMVVDKHIV